VEEKEMKKKVQKREEESERYDALRREKEKEERGG